MRNRNAMQLHAAKIQKYHVPQKILLRFLRTKDKIFTLCHTLGSFHRKFYPPTRPAKSARNRDTINNV